jgi:hypothetical protein
MSLRRMQAKQLATEAGRRRNVDMASPADGHKYRISMTLLQTYIDRAAECRRDADATTLANVRDRCLGSALAWENMADRAEKTEIYRLNEVQRKAEQGRCP